MTARTRLGLAATALFLAASPALAQSNAAADGSNAQGAYASGRYEETVRLSRAESRSGSSDARAASFRLQALAHAALGNERQAQKAADSMVRTRPRYDAQAGDTPAFNAMVTSAQTRYSRGELTSRKKGVPQFIYTGLVVGMSALTIGLGISAANAQ